MAYYIEVKVKFNDGSTAVLDTGRINKSLNHVELAVKSLKQTVATGYQEKISGQLTIGDTVINTLDTSMIAFKIKWCF